MTKIHESIAHLPLPKQVAALLYLGWTHQEIAETTGTSKGSVQHYKEQLRTGELAPPPEVFHIIRARQREIHRTCRRLEGLEEDRIGVIADRVKTIHKLELLGYYEEDGHITCEDLAAIAELVAIEANQNSKRAVVDELSSLCKNGSNAKAIRDNLQQRVKILETEMELMELEMRNDTNDPAGESRTSDGNDGGGILGSSDHTDDSGGGWTPDEAAPIFDPQKPSGSGVEFYDYSEGPEVRGEVYKSQLKGHDPRGRDWRHEDGPLRDDVYHPEEEDWWHRDYTQEPVDSCPRDREDWWFRLAVWEQDDWCEADR